MISRRIFLKDGGLALVSLGFAPSFLTRTVAAAGQPSRPRQKTLIAIFQRGAVDGLNVVVPFGEADYYRSRPTIAIPRPGSSADAGNDLDGFFALHPRMAPIHPLFGAGRLAIVHACGSPNSTRSHFDAQDYMEAGTPGIKSTGDGWLNRYLQARQTGGETPLRAVSLTPQLPRTLQGRAPALTLTRIEQFGIRAGRAGEGVGSSFETEYAAAADQVLNGSSKDAFDAIRMLKAADPARYRPAAGVEYPRSSFGQALKQIAQLVKADLGLEIAFAESGGWDHHVNEGAATGQLGARLDDFANTIAAFVRDLGSRLDDTIILTMSEFGRAVVENGNRGTDHGHGNAMMIIGGGVHGGKVYGRWPGLAVEHRYEGRDLAVTTDFRDVFAEIVVRHLGVTTSGSIFPGYEVSPGRFPGFLG